MSKNEEDRRFFTAAANVAGLSIECLKDLSKGVAQLKVDPKHLLIVEINSDQEVRSFEKAIDEQIGSFSNAVNANHFFFVGPASLHQTQFLVKSELFGHFIERTFTESDVGLFGRLLSSAIAEKAFSFEQYFDQGTKFQSIKLMQSLQKKVAIESVRTELIKGGIRPRIASSITTALDELLMNAIFDAPVDDAGKQLYHQTPRNAGFELKDRGVVELKLAYSPTHFGVSVVDQYGSLNKKKLLVEHLGKSYEREDYEVRTSGAGAGLGLAHTYRNCGGMIIYCDFGVRTEVSLFFKRTKSFKEFKDQFRFLSTLMYF